MKNWPKKGQITYKDVHLRYRPTTDKVLKGLNFEIEGGNRIGIVGRTGAGKSTIALSLTRIVEIEQGSIMIDGMNICNMPLEQVRDKITIIPQDPTLFTGSLRFNIDPKEEATDQEIIDLLYKAGLEGLLAREKTASSSPKSKSKKQT